MTADLRSQSSQSAATSTIDSTLGTETAVAGACQKIAPLWPLKHFVAVNPFLGFTSQPFARTCETFRRVVGISLFMPRDFYRQAIRRGELDERDFAQAGTAVSGLGWSPETFAALAETSEVGRVSSPPRRRVVATVSDVLDELAEGDRQVSRTAFMIDEISKWCAAYFDQSQAALGLPTRGLSPYAAWRETARYDRTAEALGIRGFRAAIMALPADPLETVTFVVRRLGIPPRAVEDYLHRALFDIQGWAGYARYQVWQSELQGRSDNTLIDVLAIRIAWGYGLFLERSDERFKSAWSAAMARADALPQIPPLEDELDLKIDLFLQEAYEASAQRRLIALLRTPNSRNPAELEKRKAVQAAFCIDVRSEIYRRALESVFPQAETLGFAGFFGFPIEYVPIGRTTGGAQCPVLLKPAFIVCEGVAGASQAEEHKILSLRLLRRRAVKAWKAFKFSAVSSFAYVEAAGLLFAAKILSDSLRLTRPVQDPNSDGLPPEVIARMGPRIEPRIVGDRRTGFSEDERLAMGEAVLKAMSLTQNFARLVLLIGHGSTTCNNPHGSSLDCGACGGHTGEANARVAAAILNDRQVRIGLEARGLKIPADTWFVAALHNTTTDEVTLFDLSTAPPGHAADLQNVREKLALASFRTREERAALLGIHRPGNVDAEISARSRDWSQVRPEWGLAGNAAFIAAPRERTRGVDLKGRAFLHSYDWRQDKDFSVLELIMSAPMVVASWINLQYYGATVDNRAFGSGNKTLHNVVGQLGVLEGNAGDLKVGLPWQSVNDGTRFIHEPLRLSVYIEAPQSALSQVIATKEIVRDLIENRWVHLFAMEESGRAFRRYLGQGQWERAA